MFESENPEFKELIQQKLEGQHFMKLIDFHLTTIEAGLIEGVLEIQEKHKQQDGFVHGGVTASLLDIVCGFAAFTLVRADQLVFTAEIKTAYLRPGQGKQLRVKGEVIKKGNSFSFCEGSVFCDLDGEEILCARASTTMAITNKMPR